MHMGDALMSPMTGGGFMVAAGAGLAFAIAKGRIELDERKIPLMGVMGAFVFAAQMLNFPVMPGTSGHLGGGALLAIVLGPHLACITMASILIVQCLIFQDGGLIALGANIINLAIIGPYLAHAAYRLTGCVVRGKRSGPVAAAVAAFVAVVAGAAAVPVETAAAGRLDVPFVAFLWTMLGIHAIIGAGEAAITVATLSYVHAIRPDAVKWDIIRGSGLPMKHAAASLLIIALLLAGVVSFYASGSPDGLEKATETWQPAGDSIDGALAGVSNAAGKLAPFPDYALPTGDERLRESRLSVGIAGAAGTIITLAVVFTTAHILRSRRHSAA